MKRRPAPLPRLAALCLAAALLLCACGVKSDLAQDDFYVWQNGQVVYTAADFYGQDFYFDYTDKFEPALISTKRSIFLGDDAEKVATAYAGAACSVYNADFSDEEYERYANIKGLAPVLDELQDLPEYWVFYEMWLVDGKVYYDSQRVLRSTEKTPLREHDQCQWYQLAFVIRDGKVQNILLSMMDFVEDPVLNQYVDPGV